MGPCWSCPRPGALQNTDHRLVVHTYIQTQSVDGKEADRRVANGREEEIAEEVEKVIWTGSRSQELALNLCDQNAACVRNYCKRTNARSGPLKISDYGARSFTLIALSSFVPLFHFDEVANTRLVLMKRSIHFRKTIYFNLQPSITC